MGTSSRTRRLLSTSALLALLAPIAASASTTGRIETRFDTHPLAVVASVGSAGDSDPVLSSLREDVAQHPGSYVAFETEISAHRFFSQHMDAQRETDRRVLTRGVLGYWQGKTLVVVPSLASANRLFGSR